MRLEPMNLCVLAAFFGFHSFAYAWDNEELEVFDVVDEVNQNFYEFLGVAQNATSSDIRKAFHKLSLQLHPDKNPAADAEIQFRKLAAIYDVLKDSKKREYYNNVLINGLPNWRSPVFYYRRVRKMGLLELGSILFVIFTIGQYLVAWAAYFEKRYTWEQVLGSKLQKMQKKNRKGKMDVPDLADILQKIPVPSMWNTLPFQLPKWCYATIVGIPSAVKTINEMLEERKRRRKEEEEFLEKEETPEPEPVPRGPRRRRQGFTPQEKKDNFTSENKIDQVVLTKKENVVKHVEEKAKVSGGLWTDDDLFELIKLVKKYPAGTSERWERIADIMNRTVNEVTYMAKKIKDEGLRPASNNDEIPIPEEKPRKVKTRPVENAQNHSDGHQLSETKKKNK